MCSQQQYEMLSKTGIPANGIQGMPLGANGLMGGFNNNQFGGMPGMMPNLQMGGQNGGNQIQMPNQMLPNF